MSVEIHKTDKYVLATIREDIKTAQLNDLLSCFEYAKANHGVLTIILDMVGASNCEDGPLQEIVREAQKAHNSKVIVFAVRVGHHMRSKLSRGGWGQILIMRETAEEALKEVGIQTKSKLDSEFIKPLVDVIMRLVQEKAGTNFKPGQIKSKKDKNTFKPNVVLVCGIVSSTFNGSLALCFSDSLFSLITDNFARQEETAGEEDSDPGNKLLQLIQKKAAAELEKLKFSIQQFIPLVLRGKDLRTEDIIPEPLLIIPFESEKGTYEIQVGLNSD